MVDPKIAPSGQIKLTPEIILRAYSAGIFPMAKDRHNNQLFWVDPEQRGIIPLNGLRISRSLKNQKSKKVLWINQLN